MCVIADKLSPTLILSKNIDHCPLCGQGNFALFEKIPSKTVNLFYLFCKDCGLIFQSPQMDEEEKNKYYASEYRLHMFGQAKPPKVDLDIQNKRAKHLVTLVQNHIENLQNTIHVDIGSGSGALIKIFHEICGTQSWGIELDNAYRQYAINQELNVFSSLDEWKGTIGLKADLVTISHVLEHLSDPVGYLVDLRRHILKTSGYLLIEVPNVYFHKSFELAHVIAFSIDTIGKVLEKAGFEVVYSKIHGIPGHLTHRYITVIAKGKDDDVVSFRAPNALIEKTLRSLGITLSQLEDFFRKVIRLTKRAMLKIL